MKQLFVFATTVLLLVEETLEFNEINSNTNVVIFFAKADPSCAQLEKHTSLSCLNLQERARVKHSPFTAENGHEKQKPSLYCRELLKDSLMSLTQFCHTVMEMKTAVASVTSKEITNNIQEPNSNPPNPELPKPKKARSIRTGNQERKFPSSLFQLSDSKKTERKNIISGPKHTEVFKIRVKRQAETQETEKGDTHEENSPQASQRKKSSWDVLDIMKHIRYSFLGNMFGKNLEKDDKDYMIDLKNLGKTKKDPGLFQMVSTTLVTLQEPPESNYVMVIFGGHLNDVASKDTPLVQSIKYVIENTEPNCTLIIVTGSCSEVPGAKKEGEMVELGGSRENYDVISMPVYAKGPHADCLSECTLLYDIPLTVRKILDRNSGQVGEFHEPKPEEHT